MKFRQWSSAADRDGEAAGNCGAIGLPHQLVGRRDRINRYNPAAAARALVRGGILISPSPSAD